MLHFLKEFTEYHTTYVHPEDIDDDLFSAVWRSDKVEPVKLEKAPVKPSTNSQTQVIKIIHTQHFKQQYN